jgi:hypothetical protein
MWMVTCFRLQGQVFLVLPLLFRYPSRAFVDILPFLGSKGYSTVGSTYDWTAGSTHDSTAGSTDFFTFFIAGSAKDKASRLYYIKSQSLDHYFNCHLHISSSNIWFTV